MATAIDITNDKYGRLIAIRFDKKIGIFHQWIFKCDCGKEISANKNAVKSGNTQSCGCLQRERASHASITHGLANTRFYHIWKGINGRCNYKKDKWYCAKGIKVLWKSFEDFYNDMVIGYTKHCNEFGEKKTTIDRINSNYNYCKENCQWATPKQQANNRNLNQIKTKNYAL